MPWPKLTLESVTRLWDEGVHNAFTDLIQFQGQYWLIFRQATNHVSDDGALVLLNSADGFDWQRRALLSRSGIDLRDPKLAVTPDGQLMVTCAGVLYEQEDKPHQSYLYFSDNGADWSEPRAVGRRGDWIWRTRFFGDCGFGVAYRAARETTSLYKLSDDQYRLWVDPLLSKETHGLGYPNEHDLFPLGENRMGCLLRRDADTATAQLGESAAPYLEWQWRDLGVRIGGPVVMPIVADAGDHRLLSAVRLYDPVRTALCWLDSDSGVLTEALTLPSGGDTSYAGLAQEGRTLLCSYYSSHEGKTSIYLARLSLGQP